MRQLLCSVLLWALGMTVPRVSAQAERVVLCPTLAGQAPQVVSLALTCMVSTNKQGFTSIEFGPSQTGTVVVVGADLGSGGGKVRAGIGRLELGWLPFDHAHGATVTVLRTWGDPWNARAKETYVGPEFFVQAGMVRLGLGALYRVAGADSRGRLIPSAEIGLGRMWAL